MNAKERAEIAKVVGDLLDVAETAMPDSFFASDRRIKRAKKLMRKVAELRFGRKSTAKKMRKG